MSGGPSYFYTYPLSVSGGAFLATTGVGIVLGAIFFRRRNVLLALFGALGMMMTCIVPGSAFGRHAPVTRLQIGSLVFAIAVEIALIPVLRRWLEPYGERTLVLGILILVGAHFVPMYPALGPLVVLLGLCVMFNAGIALRIPALGLRIVWLTDGCLKLATGLLLWFGAAALRSF